MTPGAPTSGFPDPAARLAGAVPQALRDVIDRFHEHGHAAYVVGGSLRDALLGREPYDWDLASDALPDRVIELFPGAVYENRFGTVAVRALGRPFEITTFRSDHEYADFRRPHRVEFGTDLQADLARRDFTANAIAWGRPAPRAASVDGGRRGEPGTGDLELVDPFGGQADIEARVLRAVGDPGLRFREDALRMVRGVRLAAALEFMIETGTLAAMRTHASLVGHLSGERIGAELEKLLAAPRPSVGLRLMEETGLLAVISPALAAPRGVPQNKLPGEDLWDHTLRSVDAAPAARPVVRLAALVHDIGKAASFADDRFHGHETVGAEEAAALLRSLRFPKAVIDRIAHLVQHHMFTMNPDYSDGAIRRFITRIGVDALDELLALRDADDVGSGKPADGTELAAFRARIRTELDAEHALDRNALKINGTDLMTELGLTPGPRLGRLLDELLDRVIADPALNDRPTLLLLAQSMLADMGDR